MTARMFAGLGIRPETRLFWRQPRSRRAFEDDRNTGGDNEIEATDGLDMDLGAGFGAFFYGLR